MLLHESCHFYGLLWLICLFKFSIKPGGTGRIRKRRAVRRCLCFCKAPGETPPYLISGHQAVLQTAHTAPSRGAVSVLAMKKRKSKSKCFLGPPDKSSCLLIFICPGRLVKGNALKMSIVSVSMHCISHKVQFTTHKNSSQLAALYSKK